MAIQRSSPRAIRESHQRMILERLLEAPDGLTRPELARLLGLSVPAIATLVASSETGVAAVLDKASAADDPTRAPVSGRRPEVVRIKPDLGYVVGIVLAHTHISVALADLHGKYDPERDTYTEPWDVENDLHGALGRATTAAKRLADDHGIDPETIAAISLGIAAPVQASDEGLKRRGLLRVDLGGEGPSSPWHNTDPFAALNNHLAALPDGERWSAIELHVDNDANLGALAELTRGAGRGCRHIFYVRLEDGGIGAGLVLNGRIYRGAGGIAGEFGHVVLDRDLVGINCRRCGHPCVEAVIGSMLGCRDGSCNPPLDQLVLNAVARDADAAELIKRAAEYLGRALASFVTVLNVDRILIGGPFPPQAYGLVIPPIQKALDELTITPAATDYVLELGALRDAAVLEGTIWLALERTRIDYLLERAAAARRSENIARRSRPKNANRRRPIGPIGQRP